MKKIIILNYVDTTVHVFDYDTTIWEEPEDFITDEKCSVKFELSNCNWWIVDILSINIH